MKRKASRHPKVNDARELPPACNRSLLEWIVEEIRARGPITFAQFMNFALYHPELGYYQKTVEIGKSGDFYTSPHVSPLWGRLIGKQLLEMWKILGRPENFDALEMGAGHGFLAHDILEFASTHSEFNQALRYKILETSRRLRQFQEDRLGPRVTWLESFSHVSQDTLMGCLFSNELVDSFPVHRVTCQGGRLREILVTEKDGRLCELTAELTAPALSRYFERLGLTIPEGMRTEVNLGIEPWIESVSRALRRGFVMTIDYGLPAAELFSVSRMDGTLRTYRAHRVGSDFLASPGDLDMTSHVDFTTLAQSGERAGLVTAGITDQTHFLMGIGKVEIAEALSAQTDTGLDAARRRASILNLIHPETMGGVFRVLFQTKGVPAATLSGLKDARVRL